MPQRFRQTLLNSLALTSLLAGAFGLAGGEPQQASEALAAQSKEVGARIAAEFAALEQLYKHFHTHPELSLQEAATGAKLAQEMKAFGFEVTPSFGGHGLVCIFRNGDGPTVLVRTDMDALPVIEKTGRPYASKVRDPRQVRSRGRRHARLRA